jgi:hypothetical protein
MRHPLPILILSALLLLVVSPVAAAPARVDALPAPAPFRSARLDFALVAFGQALGYGKGEIESPTRIHLTLKTPPMGNQPEQTIEVVFYDGALYSRENESTQWYLESSGSAQPLPVDEVPSDLVGAVPADVPITLIGERDVAGAATSQYQLWLGAGDRSFSTVDLFLGTQVAYLHKLQISAYSDIEDLAPLLGLDFRFYDFDSPAIKVAPPAGAEPRSSMVAIPQAVTSLGHSATGLSNVIQGLSTRASQRP